MSSKCKNCSKSDTTFERLASRQKHRSTDLSDSSREASPVVELTPGKFNLIQLQDLKQKLTNQQI